MSEPDPEKLAALRALRAAEEAYESEKDRLSWEIAQLRDQQRAAERAEDSALAETLEARIDALEDERRALRLTP
ncbi:MAG: hypothetical protein AAF577_11645 [Pseudomonadota bacterium]